MERYDYRKVEREKERKRKLFEVKRNLQITRNIRARKLGIKGHVKLKQWEAKKALYGNRCAKCKKKEDFPYVRLQMDHIKPLSQGGLNQINNIQPLCRECNSQKGSEYIFYPFVVPYAKTYKIPIKVIKGFKALIIKLKIWLKKNLNK